MSDEGVDTGREKRRKRSVVRSQTNTYYSALRQRAAKFRGFSKQSIDRAMLVVAAAFGVYTLSQVHYHLTFYPDIAMHMPAGEVVYGFGQPQHRQVLGSGDELWTYDRQGTRVVVKMRDGAVAEASCEPVTNDGECEPVLTIGTRSSERDLWLQLGRPTSVSIENGVKYADYPELGLRFTLTRFAVTRVALHDHATSLGFLPRYLRIILP